MSKSKKNKSVEKTSKTRRSRQQGKSTGKKPVGKKPSGKKKVAKKTRKKKAPGGKAVGKKTLGKKSARKETAAKPSSGSYAFEIVSREHILKHLTTQSAPANRDQLTQQFGYSADSDEAEALRRRLGAMCRDAQLIQNRNGAYVPVKSSDLVAGYISANAGGFGFVNCDDDKSDVYLNARQMHQVLHGDRCW